MDQSVSDGQRDAIVATLRSSPVDQFVSEHIIDRIPHIFGADRRAHIGWRTALAKGLSVDPSEIILVGSASVGISLNPNRSCAAFAQDSDVDIAVISFHHFDIAWNTLRRIGAERHRWPPSARASLEDHAKRLVYWGTIATDRILQYLPFAKQWTLTLSNMAALDPTAGRDLQLRIYRDFDSLRAYQRYAVTTLRTQMAEAAAETDR